MIPQQDVRAWCSRADAADMPWPSPVQPHVALSDEKPLITLVGAYNSGKTSLIKRILLERGDDIPESLAVGADPTTFDPETVPSGQTSLQDTPGLGSGNALHNRRALDSCADTDVLVLVVTPQLLSAADDDAWHLLTNEAWAGLEAPATGWRGIVINRFDLAGADPLEDPEAYRQLAERKRSELNASLASRGVAVDGLPIFVTAADPFGVVDDKTPARGDYDIGEGWDGLPELLTWLEDLPALLPTWRAQRAVRVRVRQLSTEQDSIAKALPDIEVEISISQRNLHGIESYSRELGRLREQLRVERDEALEAAIGRDAPSAAAPDRDEVVRDRLAKAIERSVQAHADRLASLAARSPDAIDLTDLPTANATTPLGEHTEGQNEVVDLLQRLRQNREVLQEAASAFRALAAETPRLKPAQAWLSDEAVKAAITAIDLLWHLGNLEAEQAAEAARRRQHYLNAAARAADQAAAPFTEWMDQLAEDLSSLEERTRTTHTQAVAARQRLREASEQAAHLIAEAPRIG